MRTLNQIKAEIIAEKEKQMLELTSTSKTAIWLLWVNVVAFAIWVFEKIMYTEKAELEKTITEKRYGSIKWYIDQIKAFQYGDSLVYDSVTGVVSYEIKDLDKQIIDAVSVSETSSNGLLIKVAKKIDGKLGALTMAEIKAIRNYVHAIKPAGVKTEVLSLAPDTIKLTATVYYNALNDEATVQTAIQQALDNYRDKSEFNGRVVVNDLRELIRDIEGVEDLHFSELKGGIQGAAPTDITRIYEAQAGYFNWAKDKMVNDWTFTAE